MVLATPENSDRSASEPGAGTSRDRFGRFISNGTVIKAQVVALRRKVVEISRGVSCKNGMAKVDGNASLLIMHAAASSGDPRRAPSAFRIRPATVLLANDIPCLRIIARPGGKYLGPGTRGTGSLTFENIEVA